MSFFTALVTSKIAATVLAGGTLAVGGTAAAAYAGALPAPLQQSAHEIIGAPAAAQASKSDQATKSDQPSKSDQTTKSEGHAPAESRGKKARPTEEPKPQSGATAVGPDATGHAAFGLCNAFTKGGLDSSSTAYLSLADAAKGSADVATYCASVTAPGKSADHGPDTRDKPQKPETPQKTKPHPPAQSEHGLSHKPAKAGKS